MSSPPSPVPSLSTHLELQKKLADATGKLVVLEFVKQDSQICEYVKKERDIIAEQMKDKAELYELDVDKFKKYAVKFKVEALPAFVVMQNFVKKRHVVGTDDLKKTIEEAYAKFQSDTEVVEQKQPEANNSASNNVESVSNNASEPENPPPANVLDSVSKQEAQCSTL